MTSVVPQPNDRLGHVVFVAQRTETCRAQQKGFPSFGSQADPPGGAHAKKVAARKEQPVAWYRADATDPPISPRSDLLGRLPSRTAVPEQLPIWMFRVDVNRAQAFVFAIVPFQK